VRIGRTALRINALRNEALPLASYHRQKETRSEGVSLKAGSWKLEAGSWKLEAGSWKLETGSWKLETGNWKLETGNWKLETGNWKLIVRPPQ
jgi:hypothetical protein